MKVALIKNDNTKLAATKNNDNNNNVIITVRILIPVRNNL